MLLLDLFYRLHLPTKTGQLRKLLLNGLQPFDPLPMSDLRIGSVRVYKAVLLVKLLNFSDLRTETRNLFPQKFEVSHSHSLSSELLRAYPKCRHGLFGENRGRADMHQNAMNIFDEQYRVVAVESHSLTIRGERSGDVLVIKADSDNPISQEEFPLGKLIRLSDPLRRAAN